MRNIVTIFSVAVLLLLSSGMFSGAGAQTYRVAVDGGASEPSPDDSAGADTESDDEDSSGSRLRIRLPDVTIEGGEIDYKSDKSGSIPIIPRVDETPTGIWGGGRFSWLVMPLDYRLDPMTDERGLSSFKPGTLMLGLQGTLSFENTLYISPYFETGFQGVRDKVGGQWREAEVTITRLGVSGVVAVPIPFYLATLGAGASAPFDFSSIVSGVGVGFGIDVGLGNLSLVMRGDDLGHDRTADTPFLYVCPKLVAIVPVTKYSRIEAYLGYSINSFNSASREFFLDDEDMVDGSDFNGLVIGARIDFGVENIYELWDFSFLPDQEDTPVEVEP